MGTVFIGSVIGEFEEYRQAAKEAIELLDQKPVMSEHLAARPYSSNVLASTKSSKAIYMFCFSVLGMDLRSMREYRLLMLNSVPHRQPIDRSWPFRTTVRNGIQTGLVPPENTVVSSSDQSLLSPLCCNSSVAMVCNPPAN